ncbi:Metallo-dependent phosphatase [Coniochaeta ligniaria NRRL 30616]|uniref:Metallo-dependent phosphatase n=1 Tax=Coniochaeta ligniaria NRRL 30616 TaxID=1408157 RepID=A0A1J7IUS2_9PEZI|nr:Metallo-dependent phosphatase [Coniochaeta ligniaria NRRL 30616]
MSEIPMSYGTTSRPPFTDVATGIADLPHEHLPSPTRPHNRLVIVGDVHGQLAALQSLLTKLDFERATDHLVLTGDMVAKGPDSAGVVKLAMDLGASAVRGNHEDRVLLAHREMVARSPGGGKGVGWLASVLGTSETTNAEQQPKQPAPSRGTEAEAAVAAGLSDKQIKWLASLPIILRVGPLGDKSPRPWNAGTVAIVHAGLVPGVPLEKQDLRAAMNMRSLVYPAEGVRRDRVREQLEEDLKAKIEKTSRGRKVTGKLEVKGEQVDEELERLEKEMGWDREMDRRVWFPVDGRDGEPWSEVWSRYMSGKEEEADRTVVVYGHDAKAGLRVEGRYAFGLDSGCVYGKQLTALVLEMGKDGGVRHRIVQVECEKAAEIKN